MDLFLLLFFFLTFNKDNKFFLNMTLVYLVLTMIFHSGSETWRRTLKQTLFASV